MEAPSMGPPAATGEAASVVVRPNPLVGVGYVVAFATFTVWGFEDLDSGTADPRSVLSVLFFAAGAVFAAIAAVRQRIEVTGDEVRVVNTFSTCVVARADLDHVARHGGTGRPAHLALIPGATVPAWSLVLDRRPGFRQVETSAIRLPSTMTSTRAAKLLGLRLTTYRGTPHDPDGWQSELDGWYRRPFIWSCIVLVAIAVALTAWGLLYRPGT